MDSDSLICLRGAVFELATVHPRHRHLPKGFASPEQPLLWLVGEIHFGLKNKQTNKQLVSSPVLASGVY